jgi:hypothetical protein
LRKRSVGQQRELRLTEERPPRHMVRVALTSGACKKGGRPEWRSHVPDPRGSGAARGAGSRGPTPNSGSQGLEGEVAGPRGGQRFLEWITSRSTTPCLMRRAGRSTRSGACSRSQSWIRGVNRGPPGIRPALPHSARQRPEGSSSSLKRRRGVGSRGTVVRLTARGADGRRHGARLGSARSRSRATGPLAGVPTVKSRR